MKDYERCKDEENVDRDKAVEQSRSARSAVIKIKVPVQKITLKTQLSMATSLAARVPGLAIATLIQELLPFMDIFPRFL